MRTPLIIRTVVLAISLWCVNGPSFAQTVNRPDSGAAQPAAKRQGFFDYALGKINPRDKDYGAAMESGRAALVENSVDDLYFWSNVVTLLLLSGLVAVVLLQWRAADKREVIAASLIAQLWNGLLTPDKVPVGFALDKRRVNARLDEEKQRFPRFSQIPSRTNSLWRLALRFAPAMLAKKPIVLQTEGLGKRSFHGRVVLLVNRHTASAAEMIIAFARENRLATIIGEKTAGRLLSATSVKVGNGFRLALPTGAYHTWKGAVLEGTPIEPDQTILFDWRDCRLGRDRQLDYSIERFRIAASLRAS